MSLIFYLYISLIFLAFGTGFSAFIVWCLTPFTKDCLTSAFCSAPNGTIIYNNFELPDCKTRPGAFYTCYWKDGEACPSPYACVSVGFEEQKMYYLTIFILVVISFIVCILSQVIPLSQGESITDRVNENIELAEN